MRRGCYYGVVMRVIPASEEYRGVKSDSNIYRMLVKYRGIPCGGIDGQYTWHNLNLAIWLHAYLCRLCVINRLTVLHVPNLCSTLCHDCELCWFWKLSRLCLGFITFYFLPLFCICVCLPWRINVFINLPECSYCHGAAYHAYRADHRLLKWGLCVSFSWRHCVCKIKWLRSLMKKQN